MGEITRSLKRVLVIEILILPMGVALTSYIPSHKIPAVTGLRRPGSDALEAFIAKGYRYHLINVIVFVADCPSLSWTR